MHDDVARAYGGSLLERERSSKIGVVATLSRDVGQGVRGRVGVKEVLRCCMRQATLRSDLARAW